MTEQASKRVKQLDSWPHGGLVALVECRRVKGSSSVLHWSKDELINEILEYEGLMA